MQADGPHELSMGRRATMHTVAFEDLIPGASYRAPTTQKSTVKRFSTSFYIILHRCIIPRLIVVPLRDAVKEVDGHNDLVPRV